MSEFNDEWFTHETFVLFFGGRRKALFHKKKVNLFFFLVAAVAAVLCDGMEFVHEHFSREQATLSSCPLMNINLSYKEFYNEKAKMWGRREK